MRIKKMVSAALATVMIFTAVSVCAADPLNINIDYNEMTEVPASYKTINAELSNFSMGTDTVEGEAKNVLQITTLPRTTSNAQMIIPLGGTIDTTKPFTLIIQMNFPTVSGSQRRLQYFPALSSGETSPAWDNNTDKAFGFYRTNFIPDNLYAVAGGSAFYVRSLIGSKGSGNNNASYASGTAANVRETTLGSLVQTDQSVTGDGSFAGKYLYYRWDVDTTAGTYKLFYSADGNAWTLAYSKFNFAKPETVTLAQEPTGRYAEKGVLPTGTLPATVKSFKFWEQANSGDIAGTLVYKIAKIQAKELLTITNSGLTDVDTTVDGLQVSPYDTITMEFSSSVDTDDINNANIYLEEIAEDGTATKVAADGLYTFGFADNNKKVNIAFEAGKALKLDAKYRLTVKGVYDANGIGSVAYNTYEFETVPRYEIVNTGVTATDADVNVAFDIKDFIKKNNGGTYQLITALVDKTTNTTVDIDASQITSATYTTTPMAVVSQGFALTAPENITADNKDNYEVRVYIWDSFINSNTLGKAATIAFE